VCIMHTYWNRWPSDRMQCCGNIHVYGFSWLLRCQNHYWRDQLCVNIQWANNGVGSGYKNHKPLGPVNNVCTRRAAAVLRTVSRVNHVYYALLKWCTTAWNYFRLLINLSRALYNKNDRLWSESFVLPVRHVDKSTPFHRRRWIACPTWYYSAT
jgi:hypothetical protein